MIRKAIIIAALCAVPVQARTLSQRLYDLPPSEGVYDGLVVLDKGFTMHCLHKDKCDERNPVFGRHPSDTALIGAGAGQIVIHGLITSMLQDHAPKLVPWWEGITIAAQGAGTMITARVTFR